jgi:hypothetical protein
VELRQYALVPRQRDVLIDLFDREFIESQEALGMRVIGQFRDLDDPDRFVWLRGFQNMSARAEALHAFYVDGSVWKAHRTVANATMIDSSNVLLLRPARATTGFSLENRDRPAFGDTEDSGGMVLGAIYYFDTPVGADFLEFFEHALRPAITAAGAPVLAYFVTESSANSFPALPVREGVNAFVWFSGFSGLAAYEQHVAALAQSQTWREISEVLTRQITGSPEILKLLPTTRSLLRG